VTAVHFVRSAVRIEDGNLSKWITVQDSRSESPISTIQGSRRYAFNIGGQQCLVQRCYSDEGRHDFVQGGTVAGPNVFHDCRSEHAHSESGPHHRWSVGTLFDNVSVDGENGAIEVINRGDSGTGHGWAGANMVLWNSDAPNLVVETAPTARNWAIGCSGDRGGSNSASYFDSHGTRMALRSLYLRQLEDRLGAQAVANIAR
jgi:hypothetical protein